MSAIVQNLPQIRNFSCWLSEQCRYTGATYLQNHLITVYRSSQQGIVIDRRDVITGSFNFTKAAQQRNAENVLLIKHNPALAATYAANWERCAAEARPLRDHRQDQRCGIATPD
jgi:hypothetical protein